MSARRKRDPEDNDDTEEVTTKKIKTESESINLSWEWEADGPTWTAYADDVNKEITDAFKSGKQKAPFSDNGKKFEVVFSRMVQRNAITCWERQIRLKEASDDEDGTWQWQDEKKKWNSYPESIQRLLKAAIICDLKQVEFSEKGNNYVVNLKRLEQANKNTKARRAVRLQSAGDQGDENSEEAAASSSRKVTKAGSKRSIKEEASSSKVKKESGKTSKKEGAAGSSIKSKSLVKKGKAPVDEECPVKNTFHVYCERNDIWDAMLNQTNLRNNNNKFYLMQLLEHDSSKQFAVWFRWGRVGVVGQSNLVRCGSDLQEAKDVFTKKSKIGPHEAKAKSDGVKRLVQKKHWFPITHQLRFSDKTKNDWEDRNSFEKVHGKYDLLKMDYEANADDTEDSVDGPSDEKLKRPDSKLDKRVQALIQLICNVQEMEKAVLEMKYDAKKAPLGKLTKEQIKAGYAALKKIDGFIRKKQIGDGLVKACDEFYTRIPHVFGMSRPPVLRTKEEVQHKMELLEALGDIEIALKVIKENKDMMLNPIDRHYKALNCQIEAVEHGIEEFQVIEKYLQNTHAKTHNTYKMEVQEIYRLEKEDETKNFNDCGNRLLLWHGSRLTNYVGILKQGLRIAPPEAPVTGYMFGKGVYFADMSSKSANYCYPSRSKPIGLVMLCEVAIGKSRELLAADYEADKLPDGYNSVKGLGKIAPDPDDQHNIAGAKLWNSLPVELRSAFSKVSFKRQTKLVDGSVVPFGVPKDTGVQNPNGYTLNYNEYIVYNTNQVKSKYLIQVKFNFT